MRRSTIWWWSIILVLVVSGGVAGWSLREPLRQSVNQVRTSLRPAAPIRFAIVGDNHGDTPMYRQILAEVNRAKVDFLLNLGDATETGTTAELQAISQLEQSITLPVYHIVGNHDIKSDDSRGFFVSAFGHTAWGSYDIGPLHLIRLDNADRRVGFSSEQLDWLADDLAENSDRITVIAFHRPFDLPLADVFGDDETPASRVTNTEFVNILSEHKIAQILTGHVHTYLPYSFHGIPAVVSGGGGDPAQTAIGGPANNFFHYLIATVNQADRTINLELHRVQAQASTATE